MEKRKTIPDTNSFGWRVKIEREKRAIDQEEMAAQLTAMGYPISQSGICKIETGMTKTPSVEMIAAIAQLLDCSLDYLIMGRERPAQPHLASETALAQWLATHLKVVFVAPEMTTQNHRN